MTENRLLKISFITIFCIIFIFSVSCFTYAETLNELKEEYSGVEAQEDASQIELETVKGELSELQTEIVELNNKIVTMELEIAELDNKTDSLSKSIKENEQK